jgi:hypothetical protein
MKVVAKRDDGALLVAEGDAALIVLGDNAWLTSKGSALARGEWEPADDPTPPAVRAKAALLAKYRTELAELKAAE